MLIVPSRGSSITSVVRMWPYATTTEMSGASARSWAMNSSPRGRSGWNTGIDFLERDALDRRRLERRARAADGPVGLCDDADDVEALADQRAERRRRELRRAPEEHPH